MKHRCGGSVATSRPTGCTEAAISQPLLGDEIQWCESLRQPAAHRHRWIPACGGGCRWRSPRFRLHFVAAPFFGRGDDPAAVGRNVAWSSERTSATKSTKHIPGSLPGVLTEQNVRPSRGQPVRCLGAALFRGSAGRAGSPLHANVIAVGRLSPRRLPIRRRENFFHPAATAGIDRRATRRMSRASGLPPAFGRPPALYTGCRLNPPQTEWCRRCSTRRRPHRFRPGRWMGITFGVPSAEICILRTASSDGAKNPMDRLSGAQKGANAPPLSGLTCACDASSERSQSVRGPSRPTAQ